VIPLDDETKALFQEVAQHLGGKLVYLRFRPPPLRTAEGELYRDENGDLVIDIDPRWGWVHAFGVLLHESAHLKLHSHIAPVTTREVQAIGIPRPANARSSPLEPPADAMAAEWDSWAEQQAIKDAKERGYQPEDIDWQDWLWLKLINLKYKKDE